MASPLVKNKGNTFTIQSSDTSATNTSFIFAPTTTMKAYNNISVYQAGPMDGCSEIEIHGWRDLLKRRYPDINWLDPSIRSYYDPFTEWKTLVEADLKDINTSNALLAYVWRTSGGTSMEILYAHSILHIPVVVVVDDITRVGPWVRYHADFIADNFNHAYEFLKATPI